MKAQDRVELEASPPRERKSDPARSVHAGSSHGAQGPLRELNEGRRVRGPRAGVRSSSCVDLLRAKDRAAHEARQPEAAPPALSEDQRQSSPGQSAQGEDEGLGSGHGEHQGQRAREA